MPVEDVEGRPDDERVQRSADAGALAEGRSQHEHDEGNDDDGGAEVQARVNRHCLVQHIPWAEADVGPHGEQIAPPVQDQGRDQRGEANSAAAAKHRMRARHRGIMAAWRGDMLNLQARQPRGPVVARKVRTPKGRVLGNGQAGKPDGECNRKNTAQAAARGRRQG